MLKTTAIHGLWQGESNVEIAEKKLAALAAEADEIADRIKATTQYFDVWEPPPHHKLRIKFLQRVLVPRLPFEKMRNALLVRGDVQVDKCRNKVRLARVG